MGEYRRRSARVLLLDRADRVLLFSFVDKQSARCWITPGGGVDDGESLAEAAARELREETGLVVAPEQLGPRVAETWGYADLGWAKGVFRDDFFHFRVDGHEVDLRGMEEFERENVLGHRWWTVDELRATEEIVYPLGLVPLLRGLLAGAAPAAPVRLPWHH